jgi:DNA helicase-2/ATP-dependent DNA helicase PcrA
MVASKPEFKIGDRVKHAKLGEGDVLDIYPLREETCIVVSFEKLGQKKLILQYAKLKLVPEKVEEPEGGDKKA